MKINKYIDETNLKAYTKKEDIEKLCENAIKYDFATVCINPCNVSLAKNLLKHSNVKVCTVIGFPLGQNTTNIKVLETREAIENGVDEIDMVINIGKLKDKDFEYVKNEIKKVRDISKDHILKIIIETCYLNDEEIKKMTLMCNELKVDYIKTSTGFGSYGARIEDIDIISKYKNDKLQIKASGGIKDYKTAIEMIEHGATRIGTSNGVKIIEEEIK
ncbi:MAG: deoxyribose-phosphate aldolase [Bacilli bacterium]|nr:deoxyribose-phosphate aldolase [Bacilli bacterium]